MGVDARRRAAANADDTYGVRNVIPLSQPGNIRFLDAVTEIVESGVPEDRLAVFLAANGVSTLVIRNDLDAARTGAPDPEWCSTRCSIARRECPRSQSSDRWSIRRIATGYKRDRLINRGRGSVLPLSRSTRSMGRSSCLRGRRARCRSSTVIRVRPVAHPAMMGRVARSRSCSRGTRPTAPGVPSPDRRAGPTRALFSARSETTSQRPWDAEHPYTRRSVEPNYRLYDAR